MNFAIVSQHGERVELCLIGERGREHRIEMLESSAPVWHTFVPGVQPGQRYGYRVHGPWDPINGDYFNPNLLLLDPYAKAIDGEIEWGAGTYSFDQNLSGYRPSKQDNVSGAMKSVVVNPFFDWGQDRQPQHSYQQTVIYEAHIKGLTHLNPKVPEEIRGTFAGIAHSATLDYLQALGITALQLMPVQQHIDARALLERGLVDYWGYHTIGFLAPQNSYAAYGTRGEQIVEFKAMVKALHERGIEVIMNVSYACTAEGDSSGPTFSFRGLDNRLYYRLDPNDKRRSHGGIQEENSLRMEHPQVLQLVMDSLRYWVLDMHVGGFCFNDLATLVGNSDENAGHLNAFFELVEQDPVVSQVKLIAGSLDPPRRFTEPSTWTKWNGAYLQDVRSFWSGLGTSKQFAQRVSGSPDLHGMRTSNPQVNVNIVSCHSGLTLRDAVSYQLPHNEANGDLPSSARTEVSWNCGVEGPTSDAPVEELRQRQQRNLLATLILSQGVPMILHGDECARTQYGNSNAFCQDNEISWMSWDTQPWQHEMLQFVKSLTSLRSRHPVFQRRRFLNDTPSDGGAPDIIWFQSNGHIITDVEWADEAKRMPFALFLNGRNIIEPTMRGQQIVDDSFIIAFNRDPASITYQLPSGLEDYEWSVVLQTGNSGTAPSKFSPQAFNVPGTSLMVLASPVELTY